jgi:hypothetical protein
MSSAPQTQTTKESATTGNVDTKRVKGRRTIHYDSFDDVLADAERLADMETKSLGNWSLGQILKHLSLSIDMMIDGGDFLMPAPLRFVLRLLMKKKMLSRTLSPGFKLPKKASRFIPPPTSTEEGLSLLRTAVQRVKSTSQRGLHPGFGKLTQQEWDEFQLRHCEMHMSFIVPA